jgi:catechol 2,3-dioxygenase-like lactoylglutathione lyase family enzyme
MPRVRNLGHIGLFVRDIEKMETFYRDFLGMTVTKRSPDGRGVFLSGDPEAVDHEIALVAGRPADNAPSIVQQISMRVETLDELRDFHKRIQAAGLKMDRLVTHLSAIGCYFFDPEGNRTEVFWLTGRPSWVIFGMPIDIHRPDEEVLADIDRVWEQTRHTAMGQAPDDKAQAAMRRATSEPAFA